MNGTIEENERIHINIKWNWDYQGNDINDTLYGSMISNYSFELLPISVKL